MKAAILENYDKSGADLVLKDIPVPTPASDEVLVKVLKPGGTLVSLRGLPNKVFAEQMGFPWWKRLMFSLAGKKYDDMAAKKNQKYRFIFVHADGVGLAEISQVFEKKNVKPSVDAVYGFAQVNDALKKVVAGGSNGKTVLRVAKR